MQQNRKYRDLKTSEEENLIILERKKKHTVIANPVNIVAVITK